MMLREGKSEKKRGKKRKAKEGEKPKPPIHISGYVTG